MLPGIHLYFVAIISLYDQFAVLCHLSRSNHRGWMVGHPTSARKNGGIIVATYKIENGVNYLTTRLNFGLPLLVHLKCLYHHRFTKSRRIYYVDALIAILTRNMNL